MAGALAMGVAIAAESAVRRLTKRTRGVGRSGHTLGLHVLQQDQFLPDLRRPASGLAAIPQQDFLEHRMESFNIATPDLAG